MNTQTILRKSKLNIGAGVLLLLYGTFNILDWIRAIISYIIPDIEYYGNLTITIYALGIFTSVLYIVIGIMLLIGARNTTLMVSSLLTVLITLVRMIISYINGISEGWYFSISNFLTSNLSWLVFFAAQILFSVVLIICIAKKPNRFTTITWMMPGTIFISTAIWDFRDMYSGSGFSLYEIPDMLGYIIIQALFCTAIFLFSRWLSCPEITVAVNQAPHRSASHSLQPQPTYIPQQPTYYAPNYTQASAPQFTSQNTFQPQQNTNLSVADELMKFKSLLDSGAITQEEYDTHKKKLLG